MLQVNISKLRIFYDSSNNIVWNIAIHGAGIFPPLEEYVANTLQIPADYGYVDITDSAIIDGFLASDTNTIVNGQVVIGTPRVIIPPIPPRDLGSEIDALNTFVGADVTPPHSTVSAIVMSIAVDKKSCQVKRIYKGVEYTFKALLTMVTADKLGKPQGVNVGDTVMITYLSHAPIGTLPIIVDKIAAIVYP